MIAADARRLRATSISIVLSVVASARGAESTLTPAWVYPLPTGVEWVEPVGTDSMPRLLVATPAGVLHLLDLATGQTRFAAPITAAPGVRLAQGEQRRDMVYCFDRYAAYAFTVGAPAGLAAQFGGRSAPDADFPGDPEVLSSWQCATATCDGLLLANNDGRVALWRPAEGAEPWVTRLGPLPVARLHLHAATAVVLSKTAGQVQASFVRLAIHPPAVRTRALGAAWPVWSTLIGDGLLTVTTSEAAVWPADGAPRTITLGVSELRATAIGVHEPSPGAARLLVLCGDQLIAFDLATGQRAWTLPVGPAHGTPMLSVTGDRVAITDERSVTLADAAGGRSFAWRIPDGERLLGWHLTRAERLYVLCGQEDNVQLSLCLRSIAAPADATSRAASQPAAAAESWLRAAGRPRCMAWTDAYLVLVEPDGLRAYKLP